MSELRDRLERLAARGNRRGADDVVRAAMRGASLEVGDDASEFEGADLPIIDDVPFVTVDLDSRRRGRGRYGSLIAAAGAAALVGVGALAVTAMFGSGGAASPEGAVRQLADAVSHKDPLAAVDVLAPTEVRSMRQTLKHLTQRAADLKIVDNAGEPLAGVDLSVDHLQLSTQSLADGYSKVTITGGEISASTHEAAMSHLLQESLRNAQTPNTTGTVDLARLASGSDLPTFVMTVRHDGNWYVSPAYTALEYARELNGGQAADFGSAQKAKLGADSPASAVTDALHAWQAGDWDRMMALAPPDELPVYDYRAWIDHQAADTHPDFTIDKLSAGATVNGDSAVVKLDASGTSGSGANKSKWQVGGTCPSTSSFFGYSSSFSDATSGGMTLGDSSSISSGAGIQQVENPGLCIAGDLGRVVPFGLVARGSEVDTQASGSVSIQVVRENGRWFISPVTTALQSVDNFIDHVDEHSLYPLIGLGYLLPPDGAITLNQPFSVTGSGLSHVYSFDGTKGQRLLAEEEGTDSNRSYASGELYTADGNDVGYVDVPPKNASWGVSPVDLPSTGSYRLVVTGRLPNGETMTVFDTDHAPKSLLNGSSVVGGTFAYPGEVCKRTLNSVACSSSSTPTTAVGSSIAPTAPTAPSLPAGCTKTNGAIACTSGATSRSVTATSSP